MRRNPYITGIKSKNILLTVLHQIRLCGAFQFFPILLKTGTVAGAFPGVFIGIPFQLTAQMGAAPGLPGVRVQSGQRSFGQPGDGSPEVAQQIFHGGLQFEPLG